MTTLLVHYLPSGKNSQTLQLLQEAQKHIQGTFREIDLLEEIPSFFNEDTLNLYYKRNFQGQELIEEEKKKISSIDKYLEKFKSSENLIMAFPMYNFSVPASVKAFLDSVIQARETFAMTEKGYQGLLPQHKALILFTSGGTYESFPELITPMMKTLLGFMGFKNVEIISAQGLANPQTKENSLQKAKELISDYFKNQKKT